MSARHFLAIALLASLLTTACGTSASAENVMRAQKEYELAVGLLGEQNIAAAFEHLFKSIDLDPKNPESRLLAGNLYLLRGDLQKAQEQLEEAVALAEKNDAFGPPFIAETQNSLGVVLVHRKRYDDAIKVLREAATNILNRNPHLAWGNLGWAYYEKGELDHALEALGQAVREEPRFCLGFFRLGQTYSKLRDYERAEDSLTRCLEVPDPACRNLQDAYHLRGEARAQLGLRTDAISDFERCVELEAQSPAGRACQRYLEATH